MIKWWHLPAHQRTLEDVSAGEEGEDAEQDVLVDVAPVDAHVGDQYKIFFIWSQIFLISQSLLCRTRGSCATKLWFGDQNEEVYFENSDNLHILVCTGLSRSIECRYPNIFVDCGKLLVRAAAACKNFPPYYSESWRWCGCYAECRHIHIAQCSYYPFCQVQ